MDSSNFKYFWGFFKVSFKMGHWSFRQSGHGSCDTFTGRCSCQDRGWGTWDLMDSQVGFTRWKLKTRKLQDKVGHMF